MDNTTWKKETMGLIMLPDDKRREALEKLLSKIEEIENK